MESAKLTARLGEGDLDLFLGDLDRFLAGDIDLRGETEDLRMEVDVGYCISSSDAVWSTTKMIATARTQFLVG